MISRLAPMVTVFALAPLAAFAADSAAPRPPNIVYILADDLGYGDLSCYGATKFKTPQVDALAARGIRFTQGYASSPTCTPTRYALLTGEYSWRKKGTGILPGDAPLIIAPGRTTVPSLLKNAGYTTAVIGKWHLGLGAGKLDFNADIKPGPLEIGFDYYFGIPSTSDRTPTVFIENHRVVNLDPNDPITVSYKKKVGSEPTAKENPELLKRYKPSAGHEGTIINGISRIGWMSGGASARFRDETRTDMFVEKAEAFIEKNKDKPFFLYFAAHEPHVPRAPHPRFMGKSGLGLRVDSILEFDAAVGRLVATIDRLGLANNTLIVLTSDNGPAVEDGYADGCREAETKAGHDASGGLRGQKCSMYEGGCRVPFIAAWPTRIPKGRASDAVVCTVDTLATVADLAGQPLGAADAPDSFSNLPAFLGAGGYARPPLYLEAFGTALGPAAIRDGDWKLVVKPLRPAAGEPDAQVLGLYDLGVDVAETKNLASVRPEIVARLHAQLMRDWRAGRTRAPGPGKP